MTTAAFPMSSPTRRDRRLAPHSNRVGVRLFGQVGRNRRPLSFAAAARQPVYLPDSAVAIIRRIADPNDPFGTRKPLI